MQLILAMLGNRWTWIALALGVLGAGWTIQTHRLKNAQTSLETLRGEYATFQAKVTAEGKIAQQRADTQAAADKLRKEQADVENTRTVTLLRQRVDSLRYDADHRGAYSLPASPADARRPDLACFDRAEYSRADGEFIVAARKIADGCDTAAVDLNTAKAWARSLPN